MPLPVLFNRICSSKLSTAALFLGIFSAPAFGEGAVEAVLAPQYAMQYKNEAWDSGFRKSYRLDFARISSGISLNIWFGQGLGYSDYGGVLRFFGTRNVISSVEELRLWYGLGVGGSYSNDFSSTVTGLGSSTAFSRILLNPFVRFTYDLNGWIAPLLEFSYEVGVARIGDNDGGSGLNHGFSIALGIAFEIER
jgi:hypothetical protein